MPCVVVGVCMGMCFVFFQVCGRRPEAVYDRPAGGSPDRAGCHGTLRRRGRHRVGLRSPPGIVLYLVNWMHTRTKCNLYWGSVVVSQSGTVSRAAAVLGASWLTHAEADADADAGAVLRPS